MQHQIYRRLFGPRSTKDVESFSQEQGQQETAKQRSPVHQPTFTISYAPSPRAAQPRGWQPALGHDEANPFASQLADDLRLPIGHARKLV